MRGLLGDRFLRLFAGDLIHRLKSSTSIFIEQNPEVEADTAVGPESSAAEEDYEKGIAGRKDVANGEEQNKRNEIKPTNE